MLLALLKSIFGVCQEKSHIKNKQQEIDERNLCTPNIKIIS